MYLNSVELVRKYGQYSTFLVIIIEKKTDFRDRKFSFSTYFHTRSPHHTFPEHFWPCMEYWTWPQITIRHAKFYYNPQVLHYMIFDLLWSFSFLHISTLFKNGVMIFVMKFNFSFDFLTFSDFSTFFGTFWIFLEFLTSVTFWCFSWLFDFYLDFLFFSWLVDFFLDFLTFLVTFWIFFMTFWFDFSGCFCGNI